MATQSKLQIGQIKLHNALHWTIPISKSSADLSCLSYLTSQKMETQILPVNKWHTSNFIISFHKRIPNVAYYKFFYVFEWFIKMLFNREMYRNEIWQIYNDLVIQSG
eukprot:293565_1